MCAVVWLCSLKISLFFTGEGERERSRESVVGGVCERWSWGGERSPEQSSSSIEREILSYFLCCLYRRLQAGDETRQPARRGQAHPEIALSTGLALRIQAASSGYMHVLGLWNSWFEGPPCLHLSPASTAPHYASIGFTFFFFFLPWRPPQGCLRIAGFWGLLVLCGGNFRIAPLCWTISPPGTSPMTPAGELGHTFLRGVESWLKIAVNMDEFCAYRLSPQLPFAN